MRTPDDFRNRRQQQIVRDRNAVRWFIVGAICFVLAWAAAWAIVIYVIAHFINKYW